MSAYTKQNGQDNVPTVAELRHMAESLAQAVSRSTSRRAPDAVRETVTGTDLARVATELSRSALGLGEAEAAALLHLASIKLSGAGAEDTRNLLQDFAELIEAAD